MTMAMTSPTCWSTNDHGDDVTDLVVFWQRVHGVGQVEVLDVVVNVQLVVTTEHKIGCGERLASERGQVQMGQRVQRCGRDSNNIIVVVVTTIVIVIIVVVVIFVVIIVITYNNVVVVIVIVVVISFGIIIINNVIGNPLAVCHNHT